uniref:Uncharacterized protein n=1 Tax=Vitis vinifera TaxID=29760 RepID=F6GWX1_VITVI
MITRSKLVEQLRDYQIRSQHKCSALAIFSPKPHITSRVGRGWGCFEAA